MKACSLSVEYVETISLALEVYRNWIEGRYLPAVILKNMQLYIMLFIESMFSTFEMTVDLESALNPSTFPHKAEAKDPQIERKLSICESVVQAYRSIAEQKVVTLSEQSW